MSKHILVVDDDESIRDLLAKFLTKQSYEVTTLPHGDELQATLDDKQFDLIVLDVMLPGDDGFELCRMIRKQHNIPIIMLTAMNEETDKIIGLELGADDYLTKPFNPRELLARIKAILRRSGESETESSPVPSKKIRYNFAGWQLNSSSRQLLNPDRMEIILSAGEYDLLLVFLQHPQRVINRDQLLDLTKNRPIGPFDRSIDVQISRLRQKLNDDPKHPKFIKTVRNGGYMFAVDVTCE